MRPYRFKIASYKMVQNILPRPLPDFVSQLWRFFFPPLLPDKICKWPGSKARRKLCCARWTSICGNGVC